ncbi:hypothetical protein [Sphingomonas humi]|uniref:hypothetical protein n=1 Tax=Sphingomonas humi TaxID=335630 RepID=UPI0031DB505F
MLGLVLITLLGVGIRLLLMMTLQQRRERENRQINERLRTLIAAYRSLGGSFTGDLSVDPTHLRDLVPRDQDAATPASGGSDRTRRMRDAVEAALSDIILLGTDDQVRLAASAAAELADKRPVHTAELVVSLRDFIRQALGLAPIPSDVKIPRQGPTRPSSGGGGRERGGDRDAGRGGGGGGGGMGGMAAGMGMGGVGLGVGHSLSSDDPAATDDPGASARP